MKLKYWIDMKNKLLLPLLFLAFNSKAQTISSSVISPSGKNSNSSTIKLNWTLGEPIVGIMTNNGAQISNGFHKQLDLEVLSIEDIETKAFIKIYPNPTNDYVVISRIDNLEAVVTIYNELGQTFLTTLINSKETEINLSQLSTGIYILNIQTKNSQKTNSYKIVKK